MLWEDRAATKYPALPWLTNFLQLIKLPKQKASDKLILNLVANIPVFNKWLKSGSKYLGSYRSFSSPLQGCSWTSQGYHTSVKIKRVYECVILHTSNEILIGKLYVDCLTILLSSMSNTSVIPGCLHSTHPFCCLSVNWSTAVLPHR